MGKIITKFQKTQVGSYIWKDAQSHKINDNYNFTKVSLLSLDLT